jgi:proline iminopeptidase
VAGRSAASHSAPSTTKPFFEPRSAIDHGPPARESRACCRDIHGSGTRTVSTVPAPGALERSTTRSPAGARPMITSSTPSSETSSDPAVGRPYSSATSSDADSTCRVRICESGSGSVSPSRWDIAASIHAAARRRPTFAREIGGKLSLTEAHMNAAESLFGDEHVRRYRETGGTVGHIWREGSTILLLTTTGRKSGQPHTNPLIYAVDGDRYVIVASKGGAPDDPGWYKNLARHPEVELQVKDEVFRARARTASGDERARLWRKACEVWPHYDEYAKKTEREIPVVVLERL